MKKQFLLYFLLLSCLASFTRQRDSIREENTADLVTGSRPLISALYQNYPNPFNESTKIKFDIADDMNVRLSVYNILGNEVAVLVNDKLSAGTYEVEWNADDLPKGNYFCKLIAGDYQTVKKMQR